MSDTIDCAQFPSECPIEWSIYGYYPSLGANAFFIAFFALFFFLNLGLGIAFKTWTYTTFMCLACLTEVIGYVGRLLLRESPFGQTGFIMQMCCIIIGPALNSGALYLTLKYITLEFGSEWSRVKPKFYTWIFITGDLIALVLQAIGGAMASTADETTPAQLENGDHITTAGISWQVFTLFVFALTVSDYVIRRSRSDTPLNSHASSTINQVKFQVFAGGIALAWLTIFTRCVYRIVEFAKGWGNPVMRNQTLFIILEGVMIVIATACQTLPHPGYCFPALSSRKQVTAVDEPKVLGDSNNSSEMIVRGQK